MIITGIWDIGKFCSQSYQRVTLRSDFGIRLEKTSPIRELLNLLVLVSVSDLFRAA